MFYIAPRLFFSFLSQGEAQQFAELSAGQDGATYKAFATQLENVRMAIFRKDAIRSLLFILLAAVPIFLYGKGKMKATPAFIILGALVLIDLFPIDKRYLNNDNFVSKQLADKPFKPTVADNYILRDKSLDFRVLNLTKDVFNDASTSYFHKSIGGYHGAKLRRYQDLITGYLNPEIRQFGSIMKNVDSDLTLQLALQQEKTLNMLNTKYIIYNPDAEPIMNPCAFGNAWIVDNIRWVETPNEEFDALKTTDLHHTAILHKEFQPKVESYGVGNSRAGEVELTEYRPNQLTYQFNSEMEQLVVFSEIWSDSGWKLYLDGAEHPLLRANYLLRAALIPSGNHQIVMQYAPKIWKVGNTIQLISSLILIIGLITAIVFSLRKKKQA